MKKVLIYLTLIILAINGCSRQDDPVPEGEGRILVLMYHRIVENEATNTYERSEADFESDLRYLKENNIKVLSFNDIEKAAISGRMPAGHSAIITFDDGDHSWYSLARPLLMKYNMKATFFLWTYMIGENSFLSWNEVEYMSHYTLDGGERPFTFGSHTYSHPLLYGRKSSFESESDYNLFLDYELRVSKNLIETHTYGEVTALALPYGDGAGDTDIISAAQRNGYKFIRTSLWGAINRSEDIDLFVIPSLPMLDDTTQDQIGYYLNL